MGFFGADLADRCFWDLCTDFPEASRARVAEGVEPVQEDCAVGDRWLRLTVTRPPESDQVFVFGTDVTQQKAAEQELAERARFPAMNPGPVFRLDSEGRVVRANPAAAGLFGRESLTGLSWLELCPEVDREPLGQGLRGTRPCPARGPDRRTMVLVRPPSRARSESGVRLRLGDDAAEGRRASPGRAGAIPGDEPGARLPPRSRGDRAPRKPGGHIRVRL